MLPVKALLVDFDGTACLQDVSEMLLDAFGEAGWERFDDAVDRGEMGLREAGSYQTAMLRGTGEEMLAFALPRAELAPSFVPFVGWAEERGLPLTLASDGFGERIWGMSTSRRTSWSSEPMALRSSTPTAIPSASAAACARCSRRNA